ncbi:permease [candidate division KSB1 bacterium]|nr:permease [candidate division KSB1 bacterium]
MNLILDLFKGGFSALLDYLSAHVLACLVPAFFIAGAISVFISQGAVIKYFGAQAKKVLSYSVASVSGSILTVCSCTVLPLFSGIYKRGAGLGPAVAFLYSGPAINILAVVYSARLLGYDIGAARAGGAILFSVIIGLIMTLLFGQEEKERTPEELTVGFAEGDDIPASKRLLFFLVLVGILIFGAAKRWGIAVGLLGMLTLILILWFRRSDRIDWLTSTWTFVKQIIPWLLGGVFMAGMLRVVLPQDLITGWVGGNSLRANLIASLFGSLMYFATLTEVPIIKALMELGMGKGPALALILAGPSLSLPNMLAIRSVLGTKKTLTYIALVVIMATLSGLAFGTIATR